jgi:hypothetical protein
MAKGPHDRPFLCRPNGQNRGGRAGSPDLESRRVLEYLQLEGETSETALVIGPNDHRCRGLTRGDL